MNPYIDLHRKLVYINYENEIAIYFGDLLGDDKFIKTIAVLTYDEVKAQKLGFFDKSLPLPNCKAFIDYTAPRIDSIDCWYRVDNVVVNMFISRFDRISIGVEFIGHVRSHFETICKRVLEN